jgi:hypothetical protein
MKQFNQPEIFYEESHEGLTNGMPFMQIEKESSIPGALFLAAATNFENKNKDVDDENEMCEIIMQMYVNSEVLKAILPEEEYDKVRESLGLISLKDAINKK